MARVSGLCRRPSSGGLGPRQRGQASVELALVLPLILTLVLFLLQVGLVVRDQIMVIHAAREGARSAAVDARHEVARLAVLGAAELVPQHTEVVLTRGSVGSVETVTVRVTYRSVTNMPLIGGLLGDVMFTESTTMRWEGSE